MPWRPTTTQLLEMDGVYARADDFRFDIVVRGEVGGQVYPDQDRAPTVKVNTNSTVKRTMDSFHLPASTLTDINPLADRVNVTALLQDGSEWRLGTNLMWAADGRPLRTWGYERRSSLADESLILNQESRRSFGYTRGTNVVAIAREIARLMWANIEVEYVPSSIVMAGGVTHAVGTTGMRMLEAAMKKLGYLPPHVNRWGRLVFRPPPPMPDEPPAGALVYGLDRIAADSGYFSNELFDAPNRWQVVDTSGQGSAIMGVYTLPSGAPHSYAKREFYVTRTETQTGLESDRQADHAARALAYSEDSAYRVGSWDSFPDYRHDMYDVVYPDAGDDEDDPGISPWLEAGWSITCRSGGEGANMSHEVRKVYPDGVGG